MERGRTGLTMSRTGASSEPGLHWTNDDERYCYSDWQQIVSAIAAMPSLTVTDPLTVGVAFGRPASYP